MSAERYRLSSVLPTGVMEIPLGNETTELSLNSYPESDFDLELLRVAHAEHRISNSVPFSSIYVSKNGYRKVADMFHFADSPTWTDSEDITVRGLASLINATDTAKHGATPLLQFCLDDRQRQLSGLNESFLAPELLYFASTALSMKIPSHLARVTALKQATCSQIRLGKKRFPCTFCCERFNTKYDWSRHEKAFHLNLERWVCTPYGGTVLDLSGRTYCAYCYLSEPSTEHVESRNHSSCKGKRECYVFNRKDHLVQHLKHFHRLPTIPGVDDWKALAPEISSRCGICGATFQSWTERANHLAKHFKAGKTMRDWTGDHGFDTSISAKVTNAIPPSLIAFLTEQPRDIEIAKTAAQYVSQEQTAAVYAKESELTDPKELMLEMGRYTRQLMELGIVPTDETLAAQADNMLCRGKTAK